MDILLATLLARKALLPMPLEGFKLWTIFAVLLILGLLGFSFHVAGGFIHLLLVIALIVLVVNREIRRKHPHVPILMPSGQIDLPKRASSAVDAFVTTGDQIGIVQLRGISEERVVKLPKLSLLAGSKAIRSSLVGLLCAIGRTLVDVVLCHPM
jgi:hypothetical protein